MLIVLPGSNPSCKFEKNRKEANKTKCPSKCETKGGYSKLT